MRGKRAERLQVMLTIDEVRKVEEWRFENRMPSRSAAVRALMNLGLRAKAPPVDQSAMLEGAVSSRDVGVVENESVLGDTGTGAGRGAVLVVESDVLVGEGVRRVLEDAGFRVIGPAAGEEARAIAGNAELAAAVIGVAAGEDTAGGDMAAEAADRLASRGVPFLFLTAGDAARDVPERHRSAAALTRADAGRALAGHVAALVG